MEPEKTTETVAAEMQPDPVVAAVMADLNAEAASGAADAEALLVEKESTTTTTTEAASSEKKAARKEPPSDSDSKPPPKKRRKKKKKIVVVERAPSAKSKKDEATWKMRFEELKAWKNEHGDTRVPRTCKTNPALGRWCQHQRELYRNRLKNKPNAPKIDPNKMAQLVSIGFEFTILNDAWEQQFAALQQHKKEHGVSLFALLPLLAIFCRHCSVLIQSLSPLNSQPLYKTIEFQCLAHDETRSMGLRSTSHVQEPSSQQEKGNAHYAGTYRTP